MERPSAAANIETTQGVLRSICTLSWYCSALAFVTFVLFVVKNPNMPKACTDDDYHEGIMGAAFSRIGYLNHEEHEGHEEAIANFRASYIIVVG